MNIPSLDVVQELLLQAPSMVDMYDRHDRAFPPSVKEWLVRMEELMAKSKVPIASNLAMLRSMIVSSERGTVPDGIVLPGKLTRSRIMETVSIAVFRKAVDIVTEEIKPQLTRVRESEELMRQLVAYGTRKNLIIGLGTIPDRTARLMATWSNLSRDPEIGVATSRVVGLVGMYDALILLDRELPEA